MKHISILGASLLGLLLLTTSCNDEWEDEQCSLCSFQCSA